MNGNEPLNESVCVFSGAWIFVLFFVVLWFFIVSVFLNSSL